MLYNLTVLFVLQTYEVYVKYYKINTYGCQMNVHESEKIAGVLQSMGYESCSEEILPDLIVFNTCCIRDNAEKKISGHIGAIKNLKEKKRDLTVVVTGCMTQQNGVAESLMKRFPFIDIILGANNLDDLSIELKKLNDRKIRHSIKINNSDRPSIFEFDGAYRTSGVNAWVNIMYGCNNFCTYCIVPHVRGRERSRQPIKIINEVKTLLDEGYKEITLLGQNVNSYGSDFGTGYGFAELLSEISAIRGSHRIRFMTSHPKDLTERIVDIIASSDTVCNYIHLPLQSGSNKILNNMNRRYTREKYLEIIDMIRNKIPDCGITTDLMVGFPGETEEDFDDTLDMVDKVGFSAAFTYIYSPRKGTPAAELTQLPYSLKSERIQRLIARQNAVTKQLSANYENKIYKILVEDAPENGVLCGRTDCGRLVKFNGSKDKIGCFVDVFIEHSASASLFGRIAE